MHIVVNGWFAGQSNTGSGQYLDHLLAHLASAAFEHRMTLLIPRKEGTGDWRLVTGSSPLSQSKVPDLQSLFIPLPRLSRPLAKLWWEQITIPQAARRLGADVLFVPYWAAPLWQPVPTVVTIHDLIPILLPAYQGGVLQRLYFRLVGLTARRAAAVITVSQASARDVVEQLRISQERVFAVPHGPNEGGEGEGRRAGEQETRLLREKYGLPERYFLYLGGFDVRKNVAGVLRAYARYLEKGGDAALKLVICGKLPGADTEFAPDPRRLAADLGLLEHVHFTGWVDEADKPAVYAGAVAYLFPSRYEGFGMMVLEAMAAGCPVITSSG